MNERRRSPLPIAETLRLATLPPKLESSAMFAGKRELIIVHQGEEYRLRITRQEKLILTK